MKVRLPGAAGLAVLAVASLFVSAACSPVAGAPKPPLGCHIFLNQHDPNGHTVFVNGIGFGHNTCMQPTSGDGFVVTSQAPPGTGQPYGLVDSRIGCMWTGQPPLCTPHSGMNVPVAGERKLITFSTSLAHLAPGTQLDVGLDVYYGHGDPTQRTGNATQRINLPTTELMVIMATRGDVLAHGGSRVTLGRVRYVLHLANNGERLQFVRLGQVTALTNFSLRPLEQYSIRHGLMPANARLWVVHGIAEIFARGKGYRTTQFAVRG